MEKIIQLPPPLSGNLKGSFAYFTVKDRLPVILTKVIDHLCQEKLSICKEFGEGVSEEIKIIVGHLSRLRNFMMTNKPIRSDSLDNCTIANNIYEDTKIWKNYINSYTVKYGEEPKWFVSSWLFVECYLYKIIHCYFQTSKYLQDYDPFLSQKIKSCQGSLPSISQLCQYIKSVISSKNSTSKVDMKRIVSEIIQISLWGNQCDLSISGGADVYQKSNPMLSIIEHKEDILACHIENFWEYLNSNCKIENSFVRSLIDKIVSVLFEFLLALILDNAGFELIADLCLLTVLMEYSLCNSVDLYSKTRPWYVSDTMKKDIEWTLNFLRNEGGDCEDLSNLWAQYIDNGLWRILERTFWTTPLTFSLMEKEDHSLYQELSHHSLIIFKGDLNYRKLVGDLDWPIDTPLEVALQGFKPSSMLILRTIKGGPVVGLNEDSNNVKRAKSTAEWNISGSFGVVQFISN